MNDLKINNMAYKIEYAQYRNREFNAWIEAAVVPTKREAWELIKARGFTAAEKGIEWMVSEVSRSPTRTWLDDACGGEESGRSRYDEGR